MLEGRYQRGFSDERLSTNTEPRIRKDDRGFFIMSLSENTKVYLEEYYQFLELTYANAAIERERIKHKLSELGADQLETRSFFRARMVIIDRLLRTVRRFYTDGANLGVIMTPWCFGTVMLEKIEVYRERLSKGEVEDPNIPDYPYYVLRYIDEIYKATLLELFDFPEKAFQMRWQYSELLKKYSTILNNITGSLQTVLTSIRNYNG